MRVLSMVPVLPLLLIGLPLLCLLAAVGAVPWGAVAAVALALGLLALVLVCVRKERAPRPGGG
ncbi:hypothetical protein [Streptomyces crystallinus]